MPRSSLAERFAAVSLGVTILLLPLAALAALRLFPPLRLVPTAEAAWLGPIGAGVVLLAAGAATIALLVTGLRRRSVPRLLLAAAAAMLTAAAAHEVLAGPAGAVSRPHPTAMIGLAAMAVLAIGAVMAYRAGVRVESARAAVLVAAATFVAVETIVLGAGLLAPDRQIGALLLVAAALVMAVATGGAVGRMAAMPLGCLAVGMGAMLFARPGSLDLLVADAALAAGAIGLLRWAVTPERATAAVSEAEERVAEIVAGLPVAALLFDGRLHLRTWSGAAEALLALAPHSEGASLESLTGLPLGRLQALGAGGVRRGRDNTVRLDHDGRRLAMNLVPVDHGLVVLLRDPSDDDEMREERDRLARELRATIEELLRARRTIQLQRQEIEHTATTDALTGVASRASILERLQLEVAQARRYAHPVAVLLLDVDDMAAINRRFGLEGGDQVLREVALRMRLRVREADALGRSAADAFLAILPHTDEAGATTFADALRRRVTQRPIMTGEASVPVTVSIGVTLMRPGDVLDADQLLARADEALASAVAGGGDRIAFDRLHGLARIDRPARKGPPGEAGDGGPTPLDSGA